jgi:predicted Zn finger-like uncharacterized protein
VDTDTKQTRCPHCSIAFYVTNAQVLAAEGTVRCGICLSLFDANENPVTPGGKIEAKPAPDDKLQESEPAQELTESLIESLLEPEARPNLESESEPYEDNSGNLSLPRPEAANPRDEQQAEAPLPQELNQLAVLLEAPPETHPDILAEQQSSAPIPEAITKPPGKVDRSSVKCLIMFALVIIATSALLIQVLFYTSAQLSLDQRYRPTLETLCGWLTCPIAEWQDLGLIQSEALVIQKHPKIEDALQVDVVITNRAAFPQRFPGLQLQFEDLQGEVVARRTFRPKQYRTGALANLTAMAPQQAYQIRLDLVTPESSAVSYSLSITK